MSAVIARLKSIDIDNTDNLFSGAFKLLIAGVGFRDASNKFYSVFSHEGDYCGRIPTYMVNSLQAHMKRQYNILSEPCGGKEYAVRFYPNDDSVTYVFADLVPHEKVHELMAHFFDKPLEIF